MKIINECARVDCFICEFYLRRVKGTETKYVLEKAGARCVGAENRRRGRCVVRWSRASLFAGATPVGAGVSVASPAAHSGVWSGPPFGRVASARQPLPRLSTRCQQHPRRLDAWSTRRAASVPSTQSPSEGRGLLTASSWLGSPTRSASSTTGPSQVP